MTAAGPYAGLVCDTERWNFTLMRQSTNKALYSYWDQVRAGRVAPRRFEIEPARIASILPETFILERVDTGELRYRLAGTRICDQFCTEFRGANFLEGWVGEDRLTLMRKLRVVTGKGAVAVFEMEAAGEGTEPVRFEFLLLPLLHAKPSVDRVLGAVSVIDPPEWLGQMPLWPKRLAGIDLIWPKQATPDHSDLHDAPEALLPHVRHAKIVRQDRRQFRVYEGGRNLDGREKV